MWLADRHPDNQTVTKDLKLDLTTYQTKLCNGMQGYEGVLCGVCRPGFGATSPFTCHACLGTAANGSSNLADGQARAKIRTGISLLYVLYWLVLTMWFVFSAWSALTATSGRHKALQNGAVVKPETTAEQSTESRRSVDNSRTARLAGVSSTAAKPAQRHTTRMLDVVKASMLQLHWIQHYWQLAPLECYLWQLSVSRVAARLRSKSTAGKHLSYVAACGGICQLRLTLLGKDAAHLAHQTHPT